MRMFTYFETALLWEYDSLESYVCGLHALGKAPESYDGLLVCILQNKLPGEVRKNVARQHDRDEWTLDQLWAALRGEIRVLEVGQATIVPQHQQQQSSSASQYPRGRQGTNWFSGTSKPIKRLSCVFCGGEHAVAQCQVISSFQTYKFKVSLKK
jgi:hypothetical protein